MVEAIIGIAPVIGAFVQFIATIGCKQALPTLTVCSTFGIVAHELTEPVAYHALIKLSNHDENNSAETGLLQYIPTKTEFAARLIGSVSLSHIGNYLMKQYGFGDTTKLIADCVFGFAGSSSGALLHDNYCLNNTLAGETSNDAL